MQHPFLEVPYDKAMRSSCETMHSCKWLAQSQGQVEGSRFMAGNSSLSSTSSIVGFGSMGLASGESEISTFWGLFISWSWMGVLTERQGSTKPKTSGRSPKFTPLRRRYIPVKLWLRGGQGRVFILLIEGIHGMLPFWMIKIINASQISCRMLRHVAVELWNYTLQYHHAPRLDTSDRVSICINVSRYSVHHFLSIWLPRYFVYYLSYKCMFLEFW